MSFLEGHPLQGERTVRAESSAAELQLKAKHMRNTGQREALSRHVWNCGRNRQGLVSPAPPTWWEEADQCCDHQRLVRVDKFLRLVPVPPHSSGAVPGSCLGWGCRHSPLHAQPHETPVHLENGPRVSGGSPFPTLGSTGYLNHLLFLTLQLYS